MQQICANTWCKRSFEIADEDLKFFDSVSPTFDGKKQQISPPKMCPACRQQRRLMFRNERKLYRSTCAASALPILSIYAPTGPYTVFSREEWWSDKWDALSYGRDYDPKRPFSEQLKSLYQDVPHVGLYNVNIENSSYTNYALNQKNCYLLFGAGDNEDCLYGKFVVYCKDVVDSLAVYSCELCYEGIASEQCYGCRYFVHSRDCSNCTMVEDCLACSDCIGCFGLRSKRYHMFNKAYSKEEYERQAERYKNLTPAVVQELRDGLEKLKATLPHVHAHLYACEHCTGESVYNSKNCFSAFDCKNCEDCKYIYFSPKTLRTQDCAFCAPDGDRFCYNVCSTVDLESSLGCFYVWYGSNMYYSLECHYNSDIFGCVGLRHKQYCVLNKQYTKEEYEKLVSRIIESMRADGTWGEYLDAGVSPFAYNETIAQEYFPLTEEEVLKRGWQWREEKDEVPKVEKIIPAAQLPESIDDIPDDILNWAIECQETKRPFTVTSQELDFYRKMHIAVPRIHPDERHAHRLAQHSQCTLFSRACAKCEKPIQTTYAPDRPEIVYCEECYLKEVY
ncbi:hypothetical protein COU80_02710 [Candidatus Peregrinibacteria bacterium CG10_big_fil_rev_8_21_14_0_10_55_24]|nr:MAG: hypothetical protein COU80_02710 [Candidatus Peregrinibacteria bacterium CG10_big_fil_rev_8_21_14_0_10_55_24]